MGATVEEDDDDDDDEEDEDVDVVVVVVVVEEIVGVICPLLLTRQSLTPRCTLRTVPQPPKFSLKQPNTMRLIPRLSIAAAHIMQGSTVT